MPIKRTLWLSVLILGATLAYVSGQQDVSGIWVIHVSKPDGTVQDTFLKLSQSGSAVTGSVIRDFREMKIAEGSDTGGKLHITANRSRTVILAYDGVLNGDRLELTYTVSGGKNVNCALDRPRQSV